jgi:hypothetical protein
MLSLFGKSNGESKTSDTGTSNVFNRVSFNIHELLGLTSQLCTQTLKNEVDAQGSFEFHL